MDKSAAVTKLYRSQFAGFKKRHEYGDVTPRYDASKDPTVIRAKLTEAADCQDDGWWDQFFKDKGRSASIFKPEEKEGEK